MTKRLYQVRTVEPLADYSELLTVSDICNLTGLSEQTIRGELSTGRLTGAKIGGRWFVSKAALLQKLGGVGETSSVRR